MTAQSLRSWVAAADSAYVNKNYYAAFRYYDAALKYDPSRIDLHYKYAESAFQFQAYPYAINAYSLVLASPQRSGYPLVPLRMAQSYQLIGNYDDAQLFYQRFIDENPNAAPADLALADQGLRACAFAKQVVENPGNLEVRNLGNSANTPEADFGAVYHNDTLYYTSSNFFNRKDTNNPPRPQYKVLTSVAGNKGQPLPEYFNEPGKQVANTAFNHDYSRVYYTICEYVDINELRCDLYFRNRAAEGWGPAQKLAINAAGYTNTQPSVGRNPDTGEETLYFVSDRPGGRGGLDLWFTSLQPDGNCSTAVNLTALNTPGNDVTPSFHSPTQVLYFSSDGYLGMGGYDVFRSFKRGGGWDTPENMGLPFNSSYHDVYFTLNESGSSALVSSNREGATLMEKEKAVCCYDIWEIELAKPFRLDVLTFSKPDGAPLPEVTVSVYELTEQGERLVSTLTNPDSNDFSFPLIRGKRYVIKGNRNGYIPDSKTIDLADPELADQDSTEVKLYLEPAGIQLDVTTFSRPDGMPLDGATVELYEITPDGRETLVATKTNPTANDFIFPLQAGKKYLLKATRPGYSPTSDMVDLNDPLLAGKSVIEKQLYLDPRALTLEVRTVRDDEQRRPLLEATVDLFELRVASLGAKKSQTNDEGNLFTFPVTIGKNYLITGNRESYVLLKEESLDLINPANIPEGDVIRKELVFSFNSGIELPVSTFNMLDGSPLTNVTVTVTRINPDGTRTVFAVETDPASNAYVFALEPGYEYEIKGERDGFATAIERVDLRNNLAPKEVKLYLKPADREFKVLTFDRITRAPLPATLVELFEIKPNGERAFLTSRTDPDGNETRFSVEADKQYFLNATRPEYFPDGDMVDLREPALANLPLIERRLYLEPAEINLEVSTLRRSDRAPLKGSTVKLYEVGPDGKETLLDTKTNRQGSDFTFPLKRGKLYVIKGDNPTYYPVSEQVDLRDPVAASSGTIRRELLFDQELPVRTFDAQTRNALPGVRIELRELEPPRPRRSDIKENPTGNEFTFPVLPGRRYLLTAEKPGYQPAVDTITIPSDPNRRLDTIEVYLREKSFTELLPLALYFDNDHPNPRTTNSTTTLDYGQTFDRYYGRKQEFIDEFTKGETLSDDDRFLIEESYENFFEREVRGGYRDLQAFSGKLLQFLRDGNSIEIVLKGLTSPRGASDYNLYLSRRRNHCVRNYFYRYKEGAFTEFIRSGKLKISNQACGENPESCGIEVPDVLRASDRFDDLKGSIFSTQASIARRVEIVDVKVGGN
jgi:5-hydroxyisourate hydrolase-like protein (transthyretin family)